MTIDYPGAIDRIITDPAWVFTDALRGLSGNDLSIVNHKTASNSQNSALDEANFFHNDTRDHKSVHVVIGRDGTVVQVVKLKDGAGGNCCLEDGHDPYWDPFKARFGNLNRCTISIEHVDWTSDNSQPMTQAQIDASFKLNLWLCQTLHIPVSHIKGHSSLDPKSKARCPGPTYPMADLLKYVGQHLQGGTTHTMQWYDYPICVPFGDPNYDSGYGGAHDMDVQTPPNTPITALLPGTVRAVRRPSWGISIGIELDQAHNGVPYMGYLHLAAVNVVEGQHVNAGDLIAWSGGCNTRAQYGATTNPKGEYFTNDSSQSSQPQTGIALMYGPVYGEGAGWFTIPPVKWELDPTPLILNARKGEEMIYPPGVPQGWNDDKASGRLYGPDKKKGYAERGFRLEILKGWDPQDIPEGVEYARNPLEDSNPSIGEGTVLHCAKTTLCWRKSNNSIYRMWQGQELATERARLKQIEDEKASLAKERDALKAQLAAAPQTQATTTNEAEHHALMSVHSTLNEAYTSMNDVIEKALGGSPS
jgi:hypothetical protein